MTLLRNQNPGEALPLPPSVPLVQKWTDVNNLAGEFRMDWQSVPVSDWPTDSDLFREMCESARREPGREFVFGIGATRYRVTWSVGPEPTNAPRPVTPTPRDFARLAQVRLFPVRFLHDQSSAPTLPEICLMVRSAIRGDCPLVIMPDEELREVREMLIASVSTWDAAEGMDLIDAGVVMMCTGTVKCIERELNRRQVQAEYEIGR